MGSGSTHSRGREGEAAALLHLQSRGWTLLGRNVREGRREIDLIVARGPVVAFVEVKYRRGDGWGHPLEAITWRKRREIAHVARGWLRAHPHPGPVFRFDAVAVLGGPDGRMRVEHVEDAWRL